MLRDVLNRVKQSANSFFATWSPTLKHSNISLSNGNLTATSTVFNTNSYGVLSNEDIVGSIYVEVTAKSGGPSPGHIGFAPASSGVGTVPPANASTTSDITATLATYSLSYNATTGAFKIKKNGVQVATGTNLKTDMRLYFACSSYNSYPNNDYATIKNGNFTYTPEYL